MLVFGLCQNALYLGLNFIALQWVEASLASIIASAMPLAIDRWRLASGLAPGEGADAEPTALIIETAHGPRIEAANPAGLEAPATPDAGAAPGGAVLGRTDPLYLLSQRQRWA